MSNIPPPPNHDARVRAAAFEFLREQCRVLGEILPWSILSKGFEFEGERVPLLSQQGIFKPRVLDEAPLSIRTAAATANARPYADEIDDSGFVVYCYRGENPEHHENRWLRNAMNAQLPLVYFAGVAEGMYEAYWPAYVVNDDRAAMRFRVALDDEMFGLGSDIVARRRYVTSLRIHRLHQKRFSANVIAAYERRCAVCRLRHAELLDGAHILPDGHPQGDPVVPNGLALCKIHHAAFDAHILGVRPDRHIAIREDVLRETDGPMLQHGLQAFHGESIWTPRRPERQPDPDRLAARFEMFRKAI